MRFVFLDALGIRTNLNVLNRGTQPYSALLYQHEGILQADNQAICNSIPVNKQLFAFLQKMKETNVDLSLTPEYSCPWAIIEHIITHTSDWPQDGKLWVFGCESITKQEIIDFREEYRSSDIFIYFEESILADHNNYLDPLIYIFRGKHEGQDKLILLVQFKTIHMGVWTDPVERNNLIQGELIYILRNSANSVHLMTLICAEALIFREQLSPQVIEEIDWHDKPYLILNPQLNPNPIHPRFLDFRRFLGTADRKELITLNWTNTSKIQQLHLTSNKTSRSGFLVKSNEVDVSPNRIKYNHKHGMYYFSLGPNKHAFILNSSAHAFHIQNLPVSIVTGVPEQQRRDGPLLNAVYSLNDTKDSLIHLANGVSDSHIDYLHEVQCNCTFLTNVNGCILEKEILVSLTTGNVKRTGSEWNQVSYIYSIQSNEQTESNNRVTFTEDDYPENISQRNKYIDSISQLENFILTNPSHFPESITDLKNTRLKIGYYHEARKDGYRYNVINDQGQRKVATLCFLGSVPESTIEKVFAQLQALFDKDNKSRERVVVFYVRGGNIMSKSDLNAGRISQTNTFDDQSFMKPGI